MRKVAFVYPHWRMTVPPRQLSYAMDIVAYELARRLTDTCRICLYIRGGWRRQPAYSHEGVLYRPVPVGPDRLFLRVLSPALRLFERRGWHDPGRPYGASVLFFLGYALQVALDIRRQRCDLIHVFIYDNFIPILRALNPRAKIILHMHDHSQADRDPRIVERHLRQADLIVGCSDYITAVVRQRFPALADRCHTVHNGVDAAHFAGEPDGHAAEPDGRRRALFVGRLSPEKGVHVLLDAFRRVTAVWPDAELELIGPDTVAPKAFVDPFDADPLLAPLRPFHDGSQRYAAFLRSKTGPDGRVRFLGEVSHAEAAAHYRAADIFVFPSLWHEPFGLPVIEAMAMGLPVIATRGGAFPEIVEDGTTGLLVPRGDAEALAAALLRLLENADLRRSMGRAARQRVIAQFSHDRSVRHWQALYERLASFMAGSADP